MCIRDRTSHEIHLPELAIWKQAVHLFENG
jgi:hypothetical protein